MDIQHQIVVDLLEAFIEDPYNFAFLWVQSNSFRKDSYAVWAAEEILEQIEHNLEIPPLFILENFRDKMGVYMCLNSHTSYIFEVAYDAAEYFIDLLTD